LRRKEQYFPFLPLRLFASCTAARAAERGRLLNVFLTEIAYDTKAHPTAVRNAEQGDPCAVKERTQTPVRVQTKARRLGGFVFLYAETSFHRLTPVRQCTPNETEHAFSGSICQRGLLPGAKKDQSVFHFGLFPVFFGEFFYQKPPVYTARVTFPARRHLVQT